MWYFQGKQYTRREFFDLLVRKNQQIRFVDIPKYKQIRLLDGDTLTSVLDRSTAIYCGERDGCLFAVTY